jgi:hypothetical protein
MKIMMIIYDEAEQRPRIGFPLLFAFKVFLLIDV